MSNDFPPPPEFPPYLAPQAPAPAAAPRSRAPLYAAALAAALTLGVIAGAMLPRSGDGNAPALFGAPSPSASVNRYVVSSELPQSQGTAKEAKAIAWWNGLTPAEQDEFCEVQREGKTGEKLGEAALPGGVTTEEADSALILIMVIVAGCPS